jgi:hypothetical protein
MATYPPPSENLPVFDSTVFSSLTDDPLTYDIAKKHFLLFPIAQGAETLQATTINGSLQVNSSATFTNTINGTIQKADNITSGTTGDLLYQSAANTTSKLPIGANTYVLTSNGTTPTWTAPFVPTTPTLSNVLVAGNSAGSNGINMNSQDITNATSITATTFNGSLNGNASSANSATTATNINGGINGDLLYQNGPSSTTKLPIGANTYVLTSNGTTPTWTAPSVVAPTPNLSQVLTTGNSAGSTSLNMNNNAISSVSTLGVSSTSTFLDTVSVNVTASGTSKAAINLRDITSQDYITVIPNNTSGTLNGIVQPNDSSIVSINSAIDTKNIVLTTHSSTKCGVRITPTTALIGAGGSGGFNPTSSISFSGTSATITGDLNMGTGSITNATAMTATTFNGSLNGNASSATNVNLSATATGNPYYLVMSATQSGTSSLLTDNSGASYNSGTNTAVMNITGDAANALACSGNSATATSIAGGTAGDLLYQSSANNTAKLGIGANTYILTSNGSAPVWSAPPVIPSTPTLSAVLTAGNSAGATDINMNGNDITGGYIINGVFHEMKDLTTLATDGSIYANNGIFNYDNNINSGTHTFAVNDAGGVQRIPLNISASTIQVGTGTSLNMGANAITNASAVTATTFNGALNGNASSATTTTNVDISNTASATHQYLTMTTNSAGTQVLKTSTTGAIYNATTNTTDMNTSGNAATATTAAACSGNSATATTATNSNNILIATDATNAAFYPTFVTSTSGNNAVKVDGDLTYNPSTNTLSVTNFSGTATNANNILTANDNTSGTYYLTFVKTAGTTTGALYKDDTTGPLTYNPSTSNLTATTFTGSLSGNANTATSATTATNANNVNISNTASGATNYVLLSTVLSGNAPVLTDTSGLSYNSTTNTLVANITGNSATTSAVPTAITVNTLTIGTATGTSQPSYGILTQGWNTGGYVAFTGTGGRTISALANEFCAGLGVRIDSWTQTVPPGIASLFEVNFTFWNSTAWGQTKYYLQLYPNRLWNQVGTSAFWNMNNAINGTSTYSYTNATYAPNGRWYWTFNQTFSGQAGAYGWFVPHTNYVDCYFSIPDNTYSYECNFKILDATSMTSQSRCWQVYTFNA